MNRRFSKDISIYKRTGWKGFSTTELVIGILGVAVGTAISWILVSRFNLPMLLAGYVVAIIVIPFYFLFFRKKKNQTIIQIVIKEKKLRKSSGEMPYRSHESEILKMESELENVIKKKSWHRRTGKINRSFGK